MGLPDLFWGFAKANAFDNYANLILAALLRQVP
jgi:hypothetical protein